MPKGQAIEDESESDAAPRFGRDSDGQSSSSTERCELSSLFPRRFRSKTGIRGRPDLYPCFEPSTNCCKPFRKAWILRGVCRTSVVYRGCRKYANTPSTG